MINIGVTSKDKCGACTSIEMMQKPETNEEQRASLTLAAFAVGYRAGFIAANSETFVLALCEEHGKEMGEMLATTSVNHEPCPCPLCVGASGTISSNGVH